MIIVIYYYHKNWTDAQWSEWCEHENLIEGLNTIQPHLFVASMLYEPKFYVLYKATTRRAYSSLRCTCNHNNVTLFANVVLEPFFTLQFYVQLVYIAQMCSSTFFPDAFQWFFRGWILFKPYSRLSRTRETSPENMWGKEREFNLGWI